MGTNRKAVRLCMQNGLVFEGSSTHPLYVRKGSWKMVCMALVEHANGKS